MVVMQLIVALLSHALDIIMCFVLLDVMCRLGCGGAPGGVMAPIERRGVLLAVGTGVDNTVRVGFGDVGFMLGTTDGELGILGTGAIGSNDGCEESTRQPFIECFSLTGYIKNSDDVKYRIMLVVHASADSACDPASVFRVKFSFLLMFGKFSNATTESFTP